MSLAGASLRTQRRGHHRFAVMACSFVVAHGRSIVGRSLRRSNTSFHSDACGAGEFQR
jgi:hypothetical protein